MAVDFDGRILAQASPGPGEQMVVAPLDLETLRHARKTRRAHQMLAHLRTECYPSSRKQYYPPQTFNPTVELNTSELETRIDDAKRRIGYLGDEEVSPTHNIEELLKISEDRENS